MISMSSIVLIYDDCGDVLTMMMEIGILMMKIRMMMIRLMIMMMTSTN